MASIQLDTVIREDTETIEETIAFMEREYPGVTGTVIKRHGPAGGWPIVEWSGDSEALTPLMKTAYGFDDEEVADWLISPKGL